MRRDAIIKRKRIAATNCGEITTALRVREVHMATGQVFIQLVEQEAEQMMLVLRAPSDTLARKFNHRDVFVGVGHTHVLASCFMTPTASQPSYTTSAPRLPLKWQWSERPGYNYRGQGGKAALSQEKMKSSLCDHKSPGLPPCICKGNVHVRPAQCRPSINQDRSKRHGGPAHAANSCDARRLASESTSANLCCMTLNA